MVNMWQPINFGGGMGGGGVIGTPGSSGGQVAPNAGMWEGINKIALALLDAQKERKSAENIQQAMKAGQGWVVPKPGPEDAPQDAWAGPSNPAMSAAEPLAGQRLGGGMAPMAQVLAQNVDPGMRKLAMQMMVKQQEGQVGQQHARENALFAQNLKNTSPTDAAKAVREMGFDPTSAEGKAFYLMALGKADNIPAAVREFQFWSRLDPAEQRNFLTVKRANPYLDLGDTKVLMDQVNQAVPQAQMPVGAPPRSTFDAAGNRVVTTPPVPGVPRPGLPPPQSGMGVPTPSAQQPPGQALQGAPPPPIAAAGGVSVQTLPVTPEHAATGFRKFESNVSQLDRMADVAKEIKEHPGLSSIVGINSLIGARFVPGTEAANAYAKMDNLKSQLAANVMQMYRDMSQSGGAVGNVSDKEQELFQNNLAALNRRQSPESFKQQLDKVIAFVDGSKARLRAAHAIQFGSPPSDGAATAAPGAQGVDDLMKRYGLTPKN